jgi:hypothetical protein
LLEVCRFFYNYGKSNKSNGLWKWNISGGL